jgi:hypothetical protein
VQLTGNTPPLSDHLKTAFTTVFDSELQACLMMKADIFVVFPETGRFTEGTQ